MTVAVGPNKIPHIGNGVTLIFGYNFLVNQSSDMKVYFNNVLVVGGYTVDNLGNPAGGNVTFDVAPALGVSIVLIRILDLNQLTNYVDLDAFPADSHEAALDKRTLIEQQQQEELDRCIKSNLDGSPISGLPIPEVGRALIWNATEDGLENSVYNPDQAQTDAQAAADAAAASAIQTAADTVQTGNDVVQTAADVVQTGNDVVAAAAEVVNAQAEVVNAQAEVVNAQAEVTYSAEWATKPEDSLISAAAGGDQVDDYSALHWAAKAQGYIPPGGIPAVGAGDANKSIIVNLAEDDYILRQDGTAFDTTSTVNLAAARTQICRINNTVNRTVVLPTIGNSLDGDVVIVRKTTDNSFPVTVSGFDLAQGGTYELYGANQWVIAAYVGAVNAWQIMSQGGGVDGALVSFAATFSHAGTIADINWDTEVYDIGGLWDIGTPNRFVIPAGYAFAELKSFVQTTDTVPIISIEFHKNNSVSFDGVSSDEERGQLFSALNIASPKIPVVEGDFFSVSLIQNSGGNIDLLSRSWFSIELIRG